MCDCQCPISSVTYRRVISRRPKKNGMVTMDIYCDCLFHGPFKERGDRLPTFHDGQLVRDMPVKPYRELGERKRQGTACVWNPPQ